MNAKVQIEKSGAVTTIILNRPESRNAMDMETTTLLAAAFEAFERDDDADVAVLWGRGQAFCAGADLKEMATGALYSAWAGRDGPLSRPCAKPVIAAIAGYACAGGLGLALWCDLRVAEETAKFAVLSRRWGIPMSDGTTVRLPRLIGTGRALDMLLTGRKVDAEEALAIGLADRLVPEGTSREAAEQLAREISGFPQLAMRSDRASAYDQEGVPLADALVAEDRLAQDAKKRAASRGASRFAEGAGRHGVVGSGAGKI